MDKIKEFSKFIDENKGHLAAIGIFAALTKYFFFTSPTDDFTKLILKDNFLPMITFLLFIFLSITFLFQMHKKIKNKDNNYLFIFEVLFFFFALAITIYFINFFKNWVNLGASIILFFLVFNKLTDAYNKYIKKLKSFTSNFIHLLIGLAIIWLLDIITIKSKITNPYLTFGIILPLYIFVIFASIILPSLNILMIIKKITFRLLDKIKEKL